MLSACNGQDSWAPMAACCLDAAQGDKQPLGSRLEEPPVYQAAARVRILISRRAGEGPNNGAKVTCNKGDIQ